MLGVFLKKSDALGIALVLGHFSKLNIYIPWDIYENDLLEMSSGQSNVYTVFHVTGKCYISETGRPSELCIKEHKYSLMQGLFEKSKLGQHSCEESYKICWK
jgi:hypothetical protein